jgi:hypothetical protein
LSDRKSTGAGAPDEIEITPEMIESGLAELKTHDIMQPIDEELRVAVSEVFRAMMRSRGVRCA